VLNPHPDIVSCAVVSLVVVRTLACIQELERTFRGIGISRHSKRSSEPHLVPLHQDTSHPSLSDGERMNNLLRTLTGSHLKSALPEADLKLLLSAVKESRRQSSDASKLSDAFYDSLEGLLVDLRAVTLDNHDAEAFLKPVSKTEVPDYHDVIANPMDLQTMLKKVKQKQYKSKKEFKDDLDLIWSNCFTYNATENHPLRQCARRLKDKAEKLLKNITDYKERADPAIPGEVPLRVVPKVNGITVNGHGRSHPPSSLRSPSPVKQGVAYPVASKKVRRDVPFSDSPAIHRTQSGMSTFVKLDRELDSVFTTSVSDNERASSSLKDQLIEYAPLEEDGDSGRSTPETSLKTVDGEIGGKRKLNGSIDDRPRKRVRMQPPAEKDVVDLWWDAMRSDELLGNGLPTLIHSSSEEMSSAAPLTAINDRPREAPRRRKKKKKSVASPKTLLLHMNNNIRMLRRVRTTHAKFAALNQSLEESGGSIQPQDLPADEVEDVLDERPWKPVGSGIEMGAENADGCLHWMGSKVLEHAGFQGTSKVALDVLASVTSEYMLNVGRTIRFLSDKYGNSMSAEEIILHTLFDSGITRIYDLERYIKDDVIRYGGRLAELEKKLANSYREATTEEAWDDEAIFRNEGDEEEEGEFVMGNFAESFGEDFLGLRELGIASEFGLSSLTIPKKLLKGKNKEGLKEGPSMYCQAFGTACTIPTTTSLHTPRLEDDRRPDRSAQAILPATYIRAFYVDRSTTGCQCTRCNLPARHPTRACPPPFHPPSAPATDPDAPPLVLPDDPPPVSHAKVGPLGQILKTSPTAGVSKKKNKGKAPAAALKGPSDGDPPLDPPAPMGAQGGADSQKKGKGTAGPSGKKKAKAPETLPPVIAASA
ncbi:hypothetical protein A0H81_10152, partial [Grifola frondosa]